MKLLNSLRLRLDQRRLRRLLADQFESAELRREFAQRHDIVVGLYSYGCFDATRIARGTRVGRYCSFAPTAAIFNGNHGMEFISLHPYLYNPALGVVARETIRRNRCVIEDDVWIGHNAVVLPSVSCIGRGAVIGAGTVVVADVPRYAVVVGNPGRVKRYRFTPEVIEQVEATRWWERDRAALADLVRSTPDLVYAPARHFAVLDEREAQA
ncbi:chloramphenicol acetyltransferase [Rubrivivax gelatinosus]|nr:chloramphenicol acetyltransferase [Rubrivivax gelatinosus]